MSKNMTNNQREILYVRDTASSAPVPVTSTDGAVNVSIASLVSEPFDYIALSDYNGNGDPGTVVYKIGGSSGTTVATLTLTYTGSNLTSVAKT